VDDRSDLLDVWNRVKSRFDDPSISPQQKAWIGLTKLLGLMDDTALLAAPNDFAREYLENRLRPLLSSVLSQELGRDIRIAVTVLHPDDVSSADQLPATSDETISVEPIGERVGANAAGPTAGSLVDTTDTGYASLDGPDDGGSRQLGGRGYRPRHSDALTDKDARLNPKYTFDTFVIGSSNRFTHAAAVAVAEAPARAYNPMFIYGDSGLGKTHLLHAIGHYAQRLQPGLRTRYISSEEFTNDFINSVRDDKMQAFQSRYRSVDLLLIDDIQFLERAERTQEEFFHTFNTLHNANKQIVISSDKSPRQLSSLEDRLRTRFEWGLISDVQAPDLETRIAILRKKAAQEGMNPPNDVLEYIASRIQSNIRELEGALIRVTAFASLNRQAVEMGLAEMVLKDLVSESDTPEISATTIMAVTAEFFAVSIDDLTSSSRSRVLVQARQIAMFLCRELTDLSLPRIGEKFGNRDHTTVMHAERKVRAQITEKLSVYNQISELTSRIKQRART
jgi:chromosomal replication initiator protein